MPEPRSRTSILSSGPRSRTSTSTASGGEPDSWAFFSRLIITCETWPGSNCGSRDGIFPASVESLKAIGVRLHALATWRDALAEARRGKLFDPAALDQVEAFLDDPDGWQARHGGAAS